MKIVITTGRNCGSASWINSKKGCVNIVVTFRFFLYSGWGRFKRNIGNTSPSARDEIQPRRNNSDELSLYVEDSSSDVNANEKKRDATQSDVANKNSSRSLSQQNDYRDILRNMSDFKTDMRSEIKNMNDKITRMEDLVKNFIGRLNEALPQAAGEDDPASRRRRQGKGRIRERSRSNHNQSSSETKEDEGNAKNNNNTEVRLMSTGKEEYL